MIALNKLQIWCYDLAQEYLGVKKEHTAYFKHVFIVIAVALGIAGAWYFYHRHTLAKEQEAFKVFNECYQEYELALNGKASWDTVNTMCQAAYDRYNSTAIAPYILAVRIEVLLVQQNLKEALELLPGMIAKMSNSSPLLNLYKTKLALLKMDMVDESVRAQGLAELEYLAADAKNLYNDVALYYMGLYYCMNNAVEKAKETWNRLVQVTASDDRQAQSPWAARAREQLQCL